MSKTRKKTNNAAGVKSASKISMVIDRLRGKEGATLDQLMKITGWQKHTVRAALTGLKKKGHTIERTLVDGTSVYRANKASK